MQCKYSSSKHVVLISVTGERLLCVTFIRWGFRFGFAGLKCSRSEMAAVQCPDSSETGRRVCSRSTSQSAADCPVIAIQQNSHGPATEQHNSSGVLVHSRYWARQAEHCC